MVGSIRLRQHEHPFRIVPLPNDPEHVLITKEDMSRLGIGEPETSEKVKAVRAFAKSIEEDRRRRKFQSKENQ